MTSDFFTERPLFGGAISSTFPSRFQDVSNVRQVPDHQEAYVDPARDESLIFELLDFKHDVGDNGSAAWFLQDLANEQEAEGGVVIEQSSVIGAPGLCYRNIPAVVTTAVGQMCAFIFQVMPLLFENNVGNEFYVHLRMLLGLLLLQMTDSSGKSPIYEITQEMTKTRRNCNFCPLSESASTVGAGFAVPATQTGCTPMAEVSKLALSSFKVHDWSLFGSAV
ncbi:hypothetical protein FH972_008996 [Carpinus fangiana]|uniref:Uncharacterized protein n=1 Tax=Carpinus fangiana TaxID=176857 RepID=A0A5N6R217_9ROSI|nr:hypothetical protein FH972_008996 [Carpinus fangiana]